VADCPAASVLGAAGDGAAIPAKRTARTVARPVVVPGSVGQPGVARNRRFHDLLSAGGCASQEAGSDLRGDVARDDKPAALGALSSDAAITLGDNDALDVAELAAPQRGRRDHDLTTRPWSVTISVAAHVIGAVQIAS